MDAKRECACVFRQRERETVHRERETIVGERLCLLVYREKVGSSRERIQGRQGESEFSEASDAKTVHVGA